MNLVVSVLNWRWILKKSRNRDSPLLRSYLQSTKHPTTLAKHKPSNIDANGGYREDAESELRHQFDQRDSAKNTSCSCRNTFPSPSPSWDLGALWKEKLCHTITSPHTPSANCETTKHNSPLRAKHHSSRSSKLIPWTQRILQFSNNTLAVSYFVRSLREKKPRNNRAESAIGAVHHVVGEHLIWEPNANYKGLSRIRALEAHAAEGDVTVVVTLRGGNIAPTTCVNPSPYACRTVSSITNGDVLSRNRYQNRALDHTGTIGNVDDRSLLPGAHNSQGGNGWRRATGSWTSRRSHEHEAAWEADTAAATRLTTTAWRPTARTTTSCAGASIATTTISINIRTAVGAAITVTIITLPEDRVTLVAMPFNWRIYGLPSFRVPSHLNLGSHWREGESTRHSCSWERWLRKNRVRNCCSHRATPLGVEPSTGVTIMEQGNLAGITIR